MTTPATLPWWREGESLLSTTIAQLPDDDLDGPSRLDGWSRRTIVAHLAGNAEALLNLMTWATTGVETPMYASPEARRAGIEQIAALSNDQLRARLVGSAARLAEAVEAAPTAAWDTEIRTALGRRVPAGQVPWMRCREVWVHTVDLNAGVTFADLPEDVLVALVDDVVRTWAGRDESPDVTVRTGGRTWGSGSSEVSGSPAEVAGVLTGRTVAPDTNGVALPRWL